MSSCNEYFLKVLLVLSLFTIPRGDICDSKPIICSLAQILNLLASINPESAR